MWLLLAELFPEILTVFRDLKNKDRKHSIIILVLFLSFCAILYHDINLGISIPIIFILTIFTIIHYLYNAKKKYKQNNRIKINQEMIFIHKKIPITYQKILGSSHKFIAQNKEIEFLLLPKYGGNNCIVINHEKIYGLSLSPIFHYCIIFYQNVIDIHDNPFDIKVTLNGYLSPYLTIEVTNENLLKNKSLLL